MPSRTMYIALAGFVVLPSLGLGQDEHEGKALFVKEKCNTCHAVASQGIEATRDSDRSPDLSNASALISDAAWEKKFIMREEEKGGKKHQRPFKGSEKDLEKIIAWLMTLESS